jgi:hypothetical protein
MDNISLKAGKFRMYECNQVFPMTSGLAISKLLAATFIGLNWRTGDIAIRAKNTAISGFGL